MKPACFEYRRVATVDEAIEHLSEVGDEAKVLAGGQSLVPLLGFRLARPRMLVDITRVEGLRYMRRDGEALRIGALTVHRAVETMRSPLADGHRILAEAARWVGHYPIRTRGTFGGSIAHADPASEWCMLAVALDAVVTAQGPGGKRDIPAGELFQGFFTTVLAPDELIIEVRFPRVWEHAAIEEFARRKGDFALVAAAVALDLEDGRCRDARIVLGGVDEVPLRLLEAERALTGAVCSTALFEEIGDLASAAISPVSDIHADAEHRRELAAVVMRRALGRAAGGGPDGDSRPVEGSSR